MSGSSFDARGDSFFRGAGHAEDIAATIVRRPTPCLRSIARPDMDARTSRRIAAYSSTFDIGIDAPSSQQSTPIVPSL